MKLNIICKIILHRHSVHMVAELFQGLTQGWRFLHELLRPIGLVGPLLHVGLLQDLHTKSSFIPRQEESIKEVWEDFFIVHLCLKITPVFAVFNKPLLVRHLSQSSLIWS